LDTEEKQEIDRLCLAVIHEQNPARLTKLVSELNVLLEARDHALVAFKPAPQSQDIKTGTG